MKSSYFEITIAGQSFTESTLSKALEKLKSKHIPALRNTRKKFRYVIDENSFSRFNGSPVIVGESVERITDREYERLQKEKRDRKLNRNAKNRK